MGPVLLNSMNWRLFRTLRMLYTFANNCHQFFIMVDMISSITNVVSIIKHPLLKQTYQKNDHANKSDENFMKLRNIRGRETPNIKHRYWFGYRSPLHITEQNSYPILFDICSQSVLGKNPGR